MADALYQEKEWLEQKYWGENLSLKEMADLIGCHPRTIHSWMIRLNIPRRTYSQCQIVLWSNANYKENMKKKRARQWESAEERIRQSERLKVFWESEEERRRQSKKLRDACSQPSRRQQMSLAAKKLWESEEYRKNHADAMREARMKRPTSIEIETHIALDIMGLEHISQFRPVDCQYTFDEFVPPNILVEVNGDYWHSLPKNANRDEQKERWAVKNGYFLIFIWEHEIHERGAWSLLTEKVVPLIE